MVKERRWLWLILILYFLLAFGYSLLMPIWEAPDEPAHYHIAWSLARSGQYPKLTANYEANQPRPYYYFASWVIRALDKINPHYSDYYLPYEFIYNIRIPMRRFNWKDENYRFLLGVYTLRWINIVFGACALWLNWIAIGLMVPDQPSVRSASIALAAFTPQYLHIMSSVNNDALGTLAGAFLFYLAIRTSKEPSIPWLLFSILLALLLPLITKLTVLPVSAALLILVALNWFFKLRKKTELIVSGLVITSGAVISYFLFPRAIQPTINDITWRLFGLHKNAWTFKYLKFILSQIIWTYWGEVGWLAVGLPPWLLNTLFGLGSFGILSSLGTFIRKNKALVDFNVLLATWLVALCAIAAVIRNGLTTDASQGRFFFPAIGALTFLMVSGWHSILSERVQQNLPMIVTIVMLSCTLILWWFGVLPVYYQPFLD